MTAPNAESEKPLKIVVASKNPVKIDAIRDAAEKLFPACRIEAAGVAVDSGVSDQPMSAAETKLGAENRVSAVQEAQPAADWWAGIEGGLEEIDDEIFAFAWIIVRNATSSSAVRTASFPIPPPVVELIRAGKELGHANDIVFGRENSKHHEGAIGTLTGGLVDRRSLYEHAAIMAMIPMKNVQLWNA